MLHSTSKRCKSLAENYLFEYRCTILLIESLNLFLIHNCLKFPVI